MLLTFKNTKCKQTTVYRIKVYVFQRKHSKTVGNGIDLTDYITMCYLTKIVKSFAQPCNILK